MPKTLRCADATTRKLLSPQHVWDTTHPNKYRDAITVLTACLKDPDPDIQLKAAKEIIAHTKGTPKSSLDITSKDKQINNNPIFLTSDPELKEMISKLSTGE